MNIFDQFDKTKIIIEYKITAFEDLYQLASVDRGVSQNVLAAKHLGPSDNADIRRLHCKIDNFFFG